MFKLSVRRKWVWFLALSALLWASGAGCGQTALPRDPQSAASGQSLAEGGRGADSGAVGGKIKVMATFYPLQFMAGAVGGDRAEVVSLIPNGAEPHDWEPRVSDIKALNEVQVFVYNGAGWEPWVSRVLSGADNKSLVAVDSSRGLKLLESAGEPDPHVWMDPINAIHQVNMILNGLVRADPAGQAVYETNAQALIKKLEAIDAEYRALVSCGRKRIVISHAFFGYPAARYGLVQTPVMADSPEAEPTPRQVANLMRLLKDEQIGYVFAEPLTGDRIIRLIAEEAGAKTLVLNPLEGLTADDQARGEDFLSLMRANLKNLKLALGCN